MTYILHFKFGFAVLDVIFYQYQNNNINYIVIRAQLIIGQNSIIHFQKKKKLKNK